MAVAAIVINYNAGELLGRCVQALLSGTLKPEVHVIDNDSDDGSAQRLNQQYGNRSELHILFNPANIGFARAVNHAVKQVSTDWVLVVNPDCVVGPTALAELMEAVESDPRAALAAPAVTGTDGRLEKAALRRFPSPWNSLVTLLGLWRLDRWFPAFHGISVRPDHPMPDPVVADAVSGACMLIRVQAFMEVGMLDEQYGLHCEDLDLMYRLRQQGWRCLFVPRAGAIHEQGVSSRSRPFWVHRQKHRGMQRFFDKFQAGRHWPPLRGLVRLGIWAHYVVTLPLVWFRK